MDTEVGIAEMAELSGLSVDTLRWYEKQGMLPPVTRGSDGRRRYSPAEQRLVQLLVTLRATGMPTALMTEFVTLMAEGAASHGRRIDVLDQTRELLLERRRSLDEALVALEEKQQHYRALIDAGLDCNGAPVPEHLVEQQRCRLRSHGTNLTGNTTPSRTTNPTEEIA